MPRRQFVFPAKFDKQLEDIVMEIRRKNGLAAREPFGTTMRKVLMICFVCAIGDVQKMDYSTICEQLRKSS